MTIYLNLYINDLTALLAEPSSGPFWSRVVPLIARFGRHKGQEVRLSLLLAKSGRLLPFISMLPEDSAVSDSGNVWLPPALTHMLPIRLDARSDAAQWYTATVYRSSAWTAVTPAQVFLMYAAGVRLWAIMRSCREYENVEKRRVWPAVRERDLSCPFWARKFADHLFVERISDRSMI